jgi:CheY-like chemotaxis protein
MTQPAAQPPDLNPSLGRCVRILLVEDSAADVAMTVAALRDARMANDVHVVGDGERAMDYLRNVGVYRDAPRPDLLLLDLNLPRKDGRELLAELQQDENLGSIPVIVLTSSSAEVDILRSYELGANAFVTKPVGFDEFLEAVRGIEDFWLALVRLPRTV